MIVCITEKPSVAREVARILGANTKHEGYFEGAGYQVTWTFGHLCTLKEPNDYTTSWKKWTLSTLPMIPPRFGIKLIADRGIEQQFKVIKELFSKADSIINCGDAGQEGELIQRWVMQKAGVKCPVNRLWISSLTDEAIRQGFKDIRPQKEFDNLYYAGLSRAIGDWILGMNATRLYTLKYSAFGSGILSIGRVQTPTLALIVERQQQIANFVPEDFWELATEYRGTIFNSTAGRFKDQAKAQAILDEIRPLPLTVTDVSKKTGKEGPRRLFDLTSLQVETNKLWGWSADRTLSLIQSLYEKKVTTYPRVDTTYLSEDLHAKIPDILRRMTPYADKTAPVLAKPITKSKKIFDNAKITDHHAIIPTGEAPNRLEGDERLLYHLIALRFIGVFYPDCVFEQTVVKAKVGNHEFKAQGKVIVDPGWRVLLPPKKESANSASKDQEAGTNSDNQNGAEEAVLPSFTVGESGPHNPLLNKKATQPPKLYTEGTLLQAMESAGKTVDDEELREAMKENGIGRPSTRSAIIETLFKRHYIARQRKSIVATQAGIDLIATIREDLIKSAKLTGIWENKLRRIERGDYSAAEFLEELKAMIAQIVQTVLTDNSQRRIITEAEKPEKSSKTKAKSSDKDSKAKSPKPRRKAIKSLEEIKCPVCGEGHILRGRTAYGCSRYDQGCTFRLDFNTASADLTPAKLNTIISKMKK